MRRRNLWFIAVATAVLFVGMARTSRAIAACTLKDPDRDIRAFFPDATGYKTKYVVVAKAGGVELLNEIEARLGEKLDRTYEGVDVEHTTYTVLKGTEPIGYVSGVNQKGQFGALQVFMATDAKGKILKVAYQRIVSPFSNALKAEKTLAQFEEITLADFYKKTEKATALTPPDEKSATDFKATVRGIRKNLIYFDFFNLNRLHDPHFNAEPKR
ncbi:MAG: hypothetical protein O3A46_14855 [Candidatus Poribacteria bacterium]|nr:hypothetical protein [Candidatus Poribacteria bacterium]